MKRNLPLVSEWCITNRLVINYDKTFQVIFKAPQKIYNSDDYKLDLRGSILEEKQTTRFLGIELDSNINFKEHLKALKKKLNLTLMMMRALRPTIDQKSMVDIYYCFFYPHLIYGIEFWGHASNTQLKSIQSLQKNALRIIRGIKPGRHVSENFEKMKIMPLHMLFEYRVLKLLLKSYSIDDIFSMKTKHEYNTRSTSLKIIKTKNKRGERSLLSSGITLFNKYLLGVWAGPGCDLSIGLAGRLWSCGGW